MERHIYAYTQKLNHVWMLPQVDQHIHFHHNVLNGGEMGTAERVVRGEDMGQRSSVEGWEGWGGDGSYREGGFKQVAWAPRAARWARERSRSQGVKGQLSQPPCGERGG